jgi:hypothetical protein
MISLEEADRCRCTRKLSLRRFIPGIPADFSRVSARIRGIQARKLRTMQMHMNRAAAAASFLSVRVQECRRRWNLSCQYQSNSLIEHGLNAAYRIGIGKRARFLGSAVTGGHRKTCAEPTSGTSLSSSPHPPGAPDIERCAEVLGVATTPTDEDHPMFVGLASLQLLIFTIDAV